MARYNDTFELSVEDMDLIESALHSSKVNQPEPVTRRIHDLLGRLHNQKVFYRPKSAPYVGG
ncbi:hypothetical protein FIU89_12910 [Roseovarius sp. THAF27]|uniref:hypothetical protein n=1 Tax=unclassified Roseovarius TaxID=2614913 RepID=UPI0012685EFA|nr:MULTISPECIES: hypothetical protein [unclassified Roseovarius]QFT81517.1 hypothetical protein FIU89_12910 [Roseovarius sp. THAF27]QFT92561.1 hypothetical protein FIU86_06890 [Roseovarius sp. THAF9]QFT99349.1 hypothetical protein FIU85_18685 [Roseovarius sp. THAF8]